jgi:hypothetical protein
MRIAGLILGWMISFAFLALAAFAGYTAFKNDISGEHIGIAIYLFCTALLLWAFVINPAVKLRATPAKPLLVTILGAVSFAAGSWFAFQAIWGGRTLPQSALIEEIKSLAEPVSQEEATRIRERRETLLAGGVYILGSAEASRLASEELEQSANLIMNFSEASYIVQLELCGHDGRYIHDIVMTKILPDLATGEINEAQLRAYVTSLGNYEAHFRNEVAGGFTTRDRMCAKQDANPRFFDHYLRSYLTD